LCVLRAGLWLSADTTGCRGNKSRFQLRDDGQYAESSFAGPEAVLAYLARYTHRVAIPNSRLLGLDERGVTFRYKDYHLIAPHACGGTLLPPLRRCRPGDPKGVCDTGDHAKITPSTAAATTNSRR
jgi:Putative transposase